MKLLAKCVMAILGLTCLICGTPSHAQVKNSCDGKHKVYICRVVACPTAKCPNRTCLQRVKVCPEDVVKWQGWSLGPCTPFQCEGHKDSASADTEFEPEELQMAAE